MSNAVFPAWLPGLKMDSTKTPIWSSLVLTGTSGREQRAAFWSYPRWKFSLAYDLLRSDALGELQTVAGFFNSRQGQYDSFLYADPTDCTATGQAIGLGDGATKVFPLLRSFGGFIEPVAAVNVLGAVYLNGVAQSIPGAVTTSDTLGYGHANALSFAVAPASGVAISADFSFYFRCRFLADQYDFDRFMNTFWEMKQIEFESVK